MKTNSFQKFVGVLKGILKLLPVVVGLGVLGFVVAWMSGMFEEKIPPGEQHAASRVRADEPTELVMEVDKEYIEEAVGTLKAASRSAISAKVLATIQDIHVTAGDFVNENDLLVTLNTEELDARLRQSREAHAAAVAALDEAQRDFTRIENLLASNAVSRREFDEAERKLRVATADERRAEQSVKEAEVFLSYSKIFAPKPGRIVDRLAEPGDTVQPGSPILSLYDSGSLRLETPVLEDLAVKLQVGQRLTVRVDSVNQNFEAVIDEIVPQADVSSRSFLVKASLPHSDNLYEGMYGRLLIPAGTRKHLCLPTDAIRRIGQLEFVDVVNADDSVSRRMIKTGRLGSPGHVEVLSGLKAGDEVLLLQGEAASKQSESTENDETGAAQ
ncbi:MAG: efflux RND transporter periplasmic adaptor subunit [Pirellulaceae bacterium]